MKTMILATVVALGPVAALAFAADDAAPLVATGWTLTAPAYDCGGYTAYKPRSTSVHRSSRSDNGSIAS